MPDVQERTMRRDGALNRERLLAVARTVFAERGANVPLEDVARAAGLSRTTLYRNFATREELAATVYEYNVARIEQRAAELHAFDDGIIRLFEFVLDMQQDNRSLAHVLTGADIEWFTALSARTEAAFEALLGRARRAGLVQSGVDVPEIMLAFPMFAGSISDPDRPGRAQRIQRVRGMLHRALFTTPRRRPLSDARL